MSASAPSAEITAKREPIKRSVTLVPADPESRAKRDAFNRLQSAIDAAGPLGESIKQALQRVAEIAGEQTARVVTQERA